MSIQIKERGFLKVQIQLSLICPDRRRGVRLQRIRRMRAVVFDGRSQAINTRLRGKIQRTKSDPRKDRECQKNF